MRSRDTILDFSAASFVGADRSQLYSPARSRTRARRPIPTLRNAKLLKQTSRGGEIGCRVRRRNSFYLSAIRTAGNSRARARIRTLLEHALPPAIQSQFRSRVPARLHVERRRSSFKLRAYLNRHRGSSNERISRAADNIELTFALFRCHHLPDSSSARLRRIAWIRRGRATRSHAHRRLSLSLAGPAEFGRYHVMREAPPREPATSRTRPVPPEARTDAPKRARGSARPLKAASVLTSHQRVRTAAVSFVLSRPLLLHLV